MAITNAFLNILIFYQRQFELRVRNTFLALGARQELPNLRSFLDQRSRGRIRYRNDESGRRGHSRGVRRVLQFCDHNLVHVHDSDYGGGHVVQQSLYENYDFESGDLLWDEDVGIWQKPR